MDIGDKILKALSGYLPVEHLRLQEEDGISGFDSLDKVYHTLNPQENTLIIVTTRRVSVDWAQIDEIYNWDWQLYVLHWDRAKGLLFIHNSSNAGFFKNLAQAVAGEVEQIRGPKIFRHIARDLSASVSA